MVTMAIKVLCPPQRWGAPHHKVEATIHKEIFDPELINRKIALKSEDRTEQKQQRIGERSKKKECSRE